MEKRLELVNSKTRSAIMLSWIFTSVGISVIAVAGLELFRDDASAPPKQRSTKARGRIFASGAQPALGWRAMTDTDLDGLVGEFLTEGNQGGAGSSIA
jgi:hypothetical protein